MIIGLEGLATVDGWVIAAIFAKAFSYAAALLAMGGAIFLTVFRREAATNGAALRRLTAVAAALGLAVLALRVEIRAARISGMGLEGMLDPVMVGIVWDSPLGSAGTMRIFGLLLIFAVLWRGSLTRWLSLGRSLSLGGAVLVALSYSQVGHSLGEPRWALASLLTVHLLAAAFWVGALVPLRDAARAPDGAVLLHRFGVIATGLVGLLIVVGVTFAWLLIGDIGGLVSTAYGWTLLAKVACIAGLLGLAAYNKLHLVPALARGEVHAAVALRRSIAVEIAVVAVILLLTAALTSVTTPPVNL